MKTTLSQQIKAIQEARAIVEEYYNQMQIVDVAGMTRITDALNDAGSTIAALNLSDPYKRIDELEKELIEANNIIQLYAHQNQNQ